MTQVLLREGIPCLSYVSIPISTTLEGDVSKEEKMLWPSFVKAVSGGNLFKEFQVM